MDANIVQHLAVCKYTHMLIHICYYTLLLCLCISSLSFFAAKPSPPAQSDTPGPGTGTPLPSAFTSATTQPMSLQQEFSLLNTSQDSSHVNSVEVVVSALCSFLFCHSCIGLSLMPQRLNPVKLF